MVDSLCATMTQVRCVISSSRAACTALSERTSSAAVACSSGSDSAGGPGPECTRARTVRSQQRPQAGDLTRQPLGARSQLGQAQGQRLMKGCTSSRSSTFGFLAMARAMATLQRSGVSISAGVPAVLADQRLHEQAAAGRCRGYLAGSTGARAAAGLPAWRHTVVSDPR